MTLEIPGGLVEGQDTPEEAAKKELCEETGYQASEMISLGNVLPNPAIQNNRCHTFLAKNVFLAGAQQLDEMEDIEVIRRPLSEIPVLIRNGEINHSLVVAAFFKYFLEYDYGCFQRGS
jgi:8-oxo-dGTP pyrophosphatase MutT (NUDIX family)